MVSEKDSRLRSLGYYPFNSEDPLPSQKDHTCLMMDWNEAVHKYFHCAMRRRYERQVTTRWLNLVNYASTKLVNGYETGESGNGT